MIPTAGEDGSAGGTAAIHQHARGDRLAWPQGLRRAAGEGVVAELLPPTRTDTQPRYRIRVYIGTTPSADEIILPEGVVFRVPRWEAQMGRDERLDHHRGGLALGWNEEIPEQ